MKYFFILIASMILMNLTMAQDIPNLEQMVTMPTSPEAAAFAKYGNTPVTQFSGTPNISVPIGNVQGRSFGVPMSMSYDPSGVRVEQLATWVGLGWNFNVGGAVTRQTNGLPDDYSIADPVYYPFYSEITGHPVGKQIPEDITTFKEYYELFRGNDPLVGNANTEEQVRAYVRFIKANSDRTVETQPDSYSFSALGLSGSFWIDYDNEIGVCVERPDLKITPLFDVQGGAIKGGNKEVLGWTIVDPQGNTYKFMAKEKTRFWDDDGLDGDHREYYSAWHLTQVTTVNSRDIIDFVYSSSNYTNEQHMAGSEVRKAIATVTQKCDQFMGNSISAIPVYKINTFELEAIAVNGITRVQFERSSRTDLEGKNKLDKVKIKDLNGDSENEITFHYSYFTNGAATPTEWEQRLRLDSVRVLGANSAGASDPNLAQTYSFDYFGTGTDMPSRDSKAQDYWGYYNGQTGNETKGLGGNGTLIPANPLYDFSGFTGADRNPRIDYAKIGTLSKIYYPTGGFTEFFYQENFVDVNTTGANAGSAFSQNVIHGAGYLNGQEDVTDPADVGNCSTLDTEIQTRTPAQFKSTMVLQEGGNYELQLEVTKDPVIPTSKDWIVIVYKDNGTEKSLCDLHDNTDPDIVYFASGAAPATYKQVLSGLEKDVIYNILMVSNSDILNMTISRYEIITYSQNNGNTGNQILVGGFRVYKIEDQPDLTTVAQKRYFYYNVIKKGQTGDLSDEFFSSSTASSGILQVPISFTSPAIEHRLNARLGNFYSCAYVQRYATNRFRSKPNIVTYSKVTEVVANGNETNGFTVYEFYNDNKATTIPSTYIAGRSGNIKTQVVYDDRFKAIQQTDYQYVQEGLTGNGGFYLQSNKYGQFDMKLGNVGNDYYYFYDPAQIGYIGNPYGDVGSIDFTITPCLGTDCLILAGQSIYTQVIYGLGENWLKQVSQTTTTFDDDIPRVVTSYNLYHESTTENFNIKETYVDDSNGNIYHTTFQYAKDLANGTNIYQDILDANRTAEVIKNKRVKGSGANEVILQEQETTFKEVAAAVTMILPDSLKYATNGGPMEARIVYQEYDTFGNPLWIVKDQLQDVAYQWDYNTSMPVAQVTGINESSRIGKNSEDLFSYSSFETANKGGWAYPGSTSSGGPPWGSNYYSLSGGDITKNIIASDRYIVSFWANAISNTTISVSGADDISLTGSAGWNYYQVEITEVTSLIISSVTGGLIDDLRIHRKGLQMTTYIYDAAKRLTSQMGPNGLPIHYKYDTLGRLKQVIDHEGNIIKQIEYGHKSTITIQP